MGSATTDGWQKDMGGVGSLTLDWGFQGLGVEIQGIGFVENASSGFLEFNSRSERRDPSGLQESWSLLNLGIVLCFNYHALNE